MSYLISLINKASKNITPNIFSPNQTSSFTPGPICETDDQIISKIVNIYLFG